MPVGYAIGSDVFDRIKPKIRQWEINKQRRIDPNVLQSMLEAEMSTETKEADSRFFRQQGLEQNQQALDAQEQARKDAKRANAISGGVGLVTSIGTGYLGYKGMKNNEKTADAYRALVDKFNSNPSDMPVGEASPTTGGFSDGNIGTGPAFSEAPDAGGQIAVTSADLQASPPSAGGQAAVAVEPTPAVDMAAYYAAPAEGASEGVGSAPSTPAGAVGSKTSMADVGAGAVVGIAAGAATNYLVTKTGEGKEGNKNLARFSRAIGMTNLTDEEYASKGSATVGAGVGGLYSGAGPWGFAIGPTIWDIENAAKTGKISNELLAMPFADRFVNTNIKSITGTVICTELHRQGCVSDSELRWVRKFRIEHVSFDTYDGYLTWATPVVTQMRKGGRFNRIVRPLALQLVRQWINIAKGQKGTLAQRATYRVAYWASRVAYRRRLDQICAGLMEVCHG